jgi:UDP-glucose 4-epimerase
MRFLITGGAGFIGSHLAERLVAEGHAVSVFDDLSTGSMENLAALRKHSRFLFTRGTILDPDLTRQLVAEAGYVIHLAAAVGVRRILSQPLASLQTNVDGTANVLSACADFGKPVMVASSSEVYGKNEAPSLCEDADSILGPSSVERWSYATAKKLDEFMALAYHFSRALPVIVTRFFNIVGPRQSARYGMVLPAFVRAAVAGEPLRVFGDGTQTRNFTYIGDGIDAMLSLIEAPLARGRIFNIGGPEEISIRALAERVRRAARSASPIETVSYEQAYPEGGFEDMRRRVPCICRIEALTGWRPKTPLAAIIDTTIRFERARAACEPALTR